MGVGGMFLDGGDAGALGLGVNVMAEVPGGMVPGGMVIWDLDLSRGAG